MQLPITNLSNNVQHSRAGAGLPSLKIENYEMKITAPKGGV